MRKQLTNLVLARGLASLAQAVSLIIVARLASVADFGLVAAFSAAAVVTFAVADLGLASFVTKSRALGQNDRVRGALRLNRISTAASGIIFLLGSLLVYAAAGSSLVYVLPLTVAFALEKNIDVALGVAVADGDRWSPGVSILLRRGLGLVLLVVGCWIGLDGLFAYGLSYLLGCIAAQAHLRRWVLRKAAPSWSSCSPTHWRELVRASFPYMLNNLSGQTRILDTTLVAVVAGATVGGIYSAAARITSPLLLIPGALGTLLMPHSARLAPIAARRAAGKVALATLAVGLIALIPTILFSSQIMSTLFGPDYGIAGTTLAWSMLGMTFIALSTPLGAILQSQGHEVAVGRLGLLFAPISLFGVGIGVMWGGAAIGAAFLAVIFLLKCAAFGVMISLPSFGQAQPSVA
ncbi:oligosaccharide flippase family protein [Glaciibacter sp. 2TAF33]|uniref:oligosaccharide flippase family protein n=1 Tax=Glaciibacter sp. 2TAF33 TaxID=3233015 RepID=UPI003F92F41E